MLGVNSWIRSHQLTPFQNPGGVEHHTWTYNNLVPYLGLLQCLPGLHKIILFRYPIWNVPWKCMILLVWICNKKSNIFFCTFFFFRWKNTTSLYIRFLSTCFCDRRFFFSDRNVCGRQIIFSVTFCDWESIYDFQGKVSVRNRSFRYLG